MARTSAGTKARAGRGAGEATEIVVDDSAAGKLDDLDRSIIRMLQEDGRVAFTSVADELGVSEGTIRNRVARLLESNVLRILGIADPMMLGYDAYAMVGLKVRPGQDPAKAAEYYRDRPEVTYVVFVAGHYDLLVEVVCETHDQLAAFLRRHCYSRSDLQSVEPMIGLAMYKNMMKWG